MATGARWAWRAGDSFGWLAEYRDRAAQAVIMAKR